MRRFAAVIGLLALTFTFSLLRDDPIGANTAISSAFNAKYGSGLTTKYSCTLCHKPGTFTEFNPYGEDLDDYLEETGECLEFFAPNTHTIAKGRCEYLHPPGLDKPFTNKCTTCHGVDLRGLIAPSCYLCHGQRWNEEPPAAPGPANDSVGGQTLSIDDAFTAIEGLDSDGDGFSNIAEINATTHPGDPASFPGGVPEIDVSMNTEWERGWMFSAGDLSVALTSSGLGEVDTDSYVVLKTPGGKLYSTDLKRKGGKVVATFPRGLLYTLFKDLSIKKETVLVEGMTDTGDKFSTAVKVRLQGTLPALIEGLSAKSNPKKWDVTKEVTLTIKGKTANLINADKPITAVGIFKRAKLKDVTVARNKITGTLSADDAAGLIGDPQDGVRYTISVIGTAKEKGTRFATAIAVFAKKGGGDTCLDFDPPGTHTEPKGDCKYLHAPGFDKPFANNCNLCHGADLKGTSIAPSCFTCHGQLWSAPSYPMTSRSLPGGNE